MGYTKKQVLKILDSCFHMFAPEYRVDAKECAIEVMKGMKNTEQQINLSLAGVMCSFRVGDKIIYKVKESKIMTIDKIEILSDKEIRLWIGYTSWVNSNDVVHYT